MEPRAGRRDVYLQEHAAVHQGISTVSFPGVERLFRRHLSVAPQPGSVQILTLHLPFSLLRFFGSLVIMMHAPTSNALVRQGTPRPGTPRPGTPNGRRTSIHAATPSYGGGGSSSSGGSSSTKRASRYTVSKGKKSRSASARRLPEEEDRDDEENVDPVQVAEDMAEMVEVNLVCVVVRCFLVCFRSALLLGRTCWTGLRCVVGR